MFTDTHCHLEQKDYDSVDDVINGALLLGVHRLIASGCEYSTNKEVLELIKKYDNVYASIGIQPCCISNNYKDTLKQIEENISNEKVLAIGEIGLDYHYDDINKDLQKEVFKEQLSLAEKYNKKVVIHSRDAVNDTIEILKKYKVTGVIHSFSGSIEVAKEYISMGYCLGINGVITFKNCKLSNVIEELDLKYIVLETDSPYLTPSPYRGEKNEPKHIMDIAKYICEKKQITMSELSSITEENIKRIFDI